MNVEATIEYLLAEASKLDALQQKTHEELDRAIRVGIRAYRQLSASQRQADAAVGRLAQRVDQVAIQQHKTAVNLDLLAAQHRETEATLNAFIRIVERRFADNQPS